ncbi:M3 family oligoendopeptidase [soil metagenome]
MSTLLKLDKNIRKFIPDDFQVKDWLSLKPYYEDLLQREIHSAQDLRKWFQDRSELESVLAEDAGWRYIKMTCNTTDDQLRDRFTYFVTQIEPNIAPKSNLLNRKAFKSPFFDDLDIEGYNILKKAMEVELKIFRENNIPLLTEIQTETQKYGAITGAMTVYIEGKELTLPQASDILQSTDRNKREEAYQKISERRSQDKDKLNELYSHLVNLRDKMAKNADFKNFRDYIFAALKRFDFTPEVCFEFHSSVAEEVVPILNELARDRKEKLQVEILKPWDKNVDPSGKEPLKPFKTSEELVDKTITCLNRLDPFLGECLAIMKSMGHLDLESRKGKSPGGYNYPLAEVGVPFIFMNATSTLRDLVTLLHEGGHAVHSLLTHGLELNNFKDTPSEIAELASMSMELITMDHWDVFFENEDDLKRAKRYHLEQIIETLPWVATIDKFQHWVYENPGHTLEERNITWNNIFDSFSDNLTDWSGLEEYKIYLWQKQLHLYEVPFYYIEYGIAQLGAIAIWKNFRENKEKGLQSYFNALKLGYTKSIPEVYEAARVKFNFSKSYINELISFIKEELSRI